MCVHGTSAHPRGQRMGGEGRGVGHSHLPFAARPFPLWLYVDLALLLALHFSSSAGRTCYDPPRGARAPEGRSGWAGALLSSNSLRCILGAWVLGWVRDTAATRSRVDRSRFARGGSFRALLPGLLFATAAAASATAAARERPVHGDVARLPVRVASHVPPSALLRAQRDDAKQTTRAI